MNTQPDASQPDASQPIYPQLSGQNWPSYLLQVWLTLHRLGVPPHNIRFLPETGHFAAPEVVEEAPEEDPDRYSSHFDSDDDANRGELRHPRGPQYDAATRRVTVYGVTPETLRPRLKVNVRSDTRIYFAPNETESDSGISESIVYEEQVGRLAHFVAPLLDGLETGSRSRPESNPESQTEDKTGNPSRSAAKEEPLAEDEDDVVPRAETRGHSSLARLTRQLCARYPELIASTPPAVRAVLSRWADAMERALTAQEAPVRQNWTENAARALPGRALPAQIAEWFAIHTAKLQPSGSEDYSEIQMRQARARFQSWRPALGEPELQARTRRLHAQIEAFSEAERAEQRQWIQALQENLARDTVRERYKIVRELVEILTTEAFTTVAVLDALWGIGWAHGRIEDFCSQEDAASPDDQDSWADIEPPAAKKSLDGLLLSMTGGFTHRALLLRLVKQWAGERQGFLGVTDSALGRGRWRAASESGAADLTAQVFSASEREELWSLVSWRREAPDPVLLLQLAAQRLIHPDVRAHLDSYQGVPGRFNTLLAQPGATAVLGGMAQVLYPGVVIYVPMAETRDEASLLIQRKLQLLLSLFLPVCMRAQVVWQEAAPYLQKQIYLKHPFQRGVRLGSRNKI